MNNFSNDIKRSLLIGFGVVLILLWVIAMMINPIRRPRFMVRNHVLRLTPMGTNIDDVVNILEDVEGWEIFSVNHERGIVLPTAGDRLASTSDKSIRVFAGRYWPSTIWIFLPTSVSIFWGFDEEGRLIEVYVQKSINP